MAWPSTPLTTYLSGGLPFVKAADLNAIQSGINGIINGTYSLHSVVVDGTGGVVVAGTAGTVSVSGTASAGAGAGNIVPWGKIYKESAIFGHCRIAAAGTIVSSFNAASVANPGAGIYEVTWNGLPTNVARSSGAATPSNTGGVAFFAVLDPPATVGANMVTTVHTFAAGGAPTNVDFDLLMFGG